MGSPLQMLAPGLGNATTIYAIANGETAMGWTVTR